MINISIVQHRITHARQHQKRSQNESSFCVKEGVCLLQNQFYCNKKKRFRSSTAARSCAVFNEGGIVGCLQ